MTIQLDRGPSGAASNQSTAWSSSYYLATRASSRFRVQLDDGSGFAWNHVYGFGKVGTATARGPQLYGNQCWSSGADVEMSWSGWSTDQLVTVRVELFGGAPITSFVVYPTAFAAGATITAGGLVLTMPPDVRVMIEVNGNRKDPLMLWSDPAEVELQPETSGQTIIVDPGNIGTLSTLGDPTRTAANPLVIVFPAGLWTLPTAAGSSTAPDRTPGIVREKAGQLWLVRPFTRIHLDRGAWVIGSLDLRQGNDIQLGGPGVLSGEWATWSDMLNVLHGDDSVHQAPGQFLTFAQQTAWAQFLGKDPNDFAYPSMACRDVTVVGAPFYLQAGPWNHYLRTKAISPWLYNCDGFGTIPDAATGLQSVTKCFAYTGDDSIYVGAGSSANTLIDSCHAITNNGAPFLVGYWPWEPDFPGITRLVTNCVAMSTASPISLGFDLHTGASFVWGSTEAEWRNVGPYAGPSSLTSCIVKLWMDGSDDEPLGLGAHGLTFDGLRVEGQVPFALFSIENCYYPWGETSAQNNTPTRRDKAGSATGIVLRNITTQQLPTFRSRLLGRDRRNTPHDITFENIVFGTVRLTSANWSTYVLQNVCPYNVTIDGVNVDEGSAEGGALNRRMRRDSRALVRPQHHGELVTFIPHPIGELPTNSMLEAIGQAPQTFHAVVDRSRRQPLGDNRDLGASVLEAVVFLPFSTDPSRGVVAVQDGDELWCSLVDGATPVRCRIIETLSEDEGGFLVRVQR